jgi:hypothetical protein
LKNVDNALYMQGIKQKIVENKSALGIVAGTVVLVIILGVFLGKGGLKNVDNQFAGVAGSFTEDENKAEISVVANPVYSPKIKYPVFASPDMFDYSGKANSCGDEIVWITTNVPQPQFVWRATLEEMINSKLDLGYLPGNFLASQKNIKLEKAVIENGIAKAYLTGSFEFNKKDNCDQNRPISQIVEAGMQFGNVRFVQVYLNGELLNK